MNKNARLGLLIVSGVLLFIVGLFAIGNRTFLFSNTMQVQSSFTRVAGLQSGAQVHYQGVGVGRVESVRLPVEPGGRITVTMSIAQRAQHLIRENTQAQIKSDGLVGEQIIVLVNPAEVADPIEEGGVLPGIDPIDVFEITDRAMASVQNFESAAIAFEEIMRDVQRGEGTLGKVIYDSTLYYEVVQTTNETRRVMSSLAASAETSAEILVDLVEEAAGSINSILVKAESGEGTLGRLLNDPSVYESLLATSDTLQSMSRDLRNISQSAENAMAWGELGTFRFAELMEAAKHNWLFKRYFEERGYVEQAPFEVRERALSETFRQITQRERELLEWENELRARENRLQADSLDVRDSDGQP